MTDHIPDRHRRLYWLIDNVPEAGPVDRALMLASALYEVHSPDRREPYFEPAGLLRGMACGPVTAYAEARLKQLHWPTTWTTLLKAQRKETK